ncbi:MAG TPA: Fe-S cluster assembly protein SufB, partial [Chlamydiales bacterium]|nr:Fe-S cluster assembly protein SufB [Chlamydiales bacterium]
MSAEPTFESTEYKYGFVTEVETESLPKGINEEIIAKISLMKGEPSWMLDFRLKSFKKWREMIEPTWANVTHAPIDYQNIIYFSAPKKRPKLNNLSEADPEVLKTFEKLGIPLEEQARLVNANVAVDLVFDSVSIGTTFQKKLKDAGVILCSITEAIHNYPDLVKKYLGSVVPIGDNFYAALNSAVFSDGSFVYVPKGVRCPMEVSTYFRINDRDSGQFERTLIICEDDAYVSYLEGCTAPAYDTNQLHAAVVELIAKDRAEIKYSTIQNWYSGNPKTGEGGIYNFVTKRGLCLGDSSKISWTQVEAGAAITWKYPSCILKGDN